MKLFAKIISMLLVLAMVLSFAACSDDSSKNDDDDDDKTEESSKAESSETSDADSSAVSDDESSATSEPEVSTPATSEPEVSTPEVSEPEVSEPENAVTDAAILGEWHCDFDIVALLKAGMGLDLNDDAFVIDLIFVFDENGDLTASAGEIDATELNEFYTAVAVATYDAYVEAGYYNGTYEEFLEENGGLESLAEELDINELVSSMSGTYEYKDGIVAVTGPDSEGTYNLGGIEGDTLTFIGEYDENGELITDVGYPMVFTKVA